MAVFIFRGSMWYGSSEVPCPEIRLLGGDVFTWRGPRMRSNGRSLTLLDPDNPVSRG